jgi:hypothetical protein
MLVHVAEFKEAPLAQRCAELLNKHGDRDE